MPLAQLSQDSARDSLLGESRSSSGTPQEPLPLPRLEQGRFFPFTDDDAVVVSMMARHAAAAIQSAA